MGRTGEAAPELDVTDMDKDRLSVHIKNAEECKGKRKKRISESAEDYEIVYEREVPPIHGILKQRSRTQSESSIEEVLTPGSYHRQHSSASFSGTGSNESSVMEGSAGSDENLDSSWGRRKTVSFSEHVDQASYKCNASVMTLKATLKNKRKSKKRREQKEGKQGRRRRTSSCSEPSSDDQSGSSASLERSNSLDDLDDVDDDLEGMSHAQVTKEQLKASAKSIVLPPGEQKEKQVATPSEEVTRTSEKVSADDYGTSDSSKDEATSAPVSSNQVSGNSHTTANNKSSNKKKKNKKARRQNSSDSASSESSENEKNASSTAVSSAAVSSTADTTDGPESGDATTKADTMLSWEDRKEVLDPLGLHKPQCVLSFSNSVI